MNLLNSGGSALLIILSIVLYFALLYIASWIVAKIFSKVFQSDKAIRLQEAQLFLLAEIAKNQGVDPEKIENWKEYAVPT